MWLVSSRDKNRLGRSERSSPERVKRESPPLASQPLEMEPRDYRENSAIEPFPQGDLRKLLLKLTESIVRPFLRSHVDLTAKLKECRDLACKRLVQVSYGSNNVHDLLPPLRVPAPVVVVVGREQDMHYTIDVR